MADDKPKTVGKLRVMNFPSTATILALGVISLLAIVVFLLFSKEVPKENVSPLNIVIGAVITAAGTVLSFYFGDSKKSSLQQDTINSLTNAPLVDKKIVVENRDEKEKDQ